MGTPYTSQSASGYNLSPPPDDGAHVAANKVAWATIKTKLGDPTKGLGDSINTALLTALDTTCTAQSSAYTTTLADHIKPIQVTGTTTISLGTASSMGNGYETTICNVGAAVVTVALITATDTLNGTVNGTITVPINGSMTFSVNLGQDGYIITAIGGALNIPGSLAVTGLSDFSAAGVKLGTQHLSYGGTAAGLSFDSSNNATFSAAISGTTGVFSGSLKTNASLRIDAASPELDFFDTAVYKWSLYYDTGTTHFKCVNAAGTGMYMVDGAQVWTGTSDERLKTITGDFKGALDFVANKVRTVRGYFTADQNKRRHSFMFAQDWQTFLPEAVDVNDPDKLGLAYEATIPVAFAAIKELAALNTQLRADLDALKARMQ